MEHILPFLDKITALTLLKIGHIEMLIDKIPTLVLLIVMSIGLRVLLQILGQRWITTTAHTSTLVLLPILTYTITSVISGNIALSLGMVGALSIVRFRHPVRSPLELSVYFGAITMGIAASVNLIWLIFLGGSVVVTVLALLSMHYLSHKILNKPFFNASFSEGNSLSTLEVSSLEEVLQLEQSVHLIVKRGTKERKEYILSSRNFEELQIIEQTIKNNSSIIDYHLTK